MNPLGNVVLCINVVVSHPSLTLQSDDFTSDTEHMHFIRYSKLGSSPTFVVIIQINVISNQINADGICTTYIRVTTPSNSIEQLHISKTKASNKFIPAIFIRCIYVFLYPTCRQNIDFAADYLSFGLKLISCWVQMEFHRNFHLLIFCPAVYDQGMVAMITTHQLVYHIPHVRKILLNQFNT